MSSAFEQLAEQRIEEAIKNGFFDDLPNKGEKIDLEAYFSTPAHLRMGHSVLKSGGFVPPEVELMRDIFDIETRLTTEEDPRCSKSLERQLSYKKAELAMAMERIRQQTRADHLSGQAW